MTNLSGANLNRREATGPKGEGRDSPSNFPRYPEYKDSGVEWLGEVPAHWEVKRLRYVAELNPSKTEVRTLPVERSVSFIPMEAVGEDGSLSLVQTRPIGEVLAGYTYVREGDVTIAKITPCFENGKGAVMRGLENRVGFGTTELIVLRPKASWTTSEYLYRVVSSEPFRVLGESSMYGAGGQKRVPDDFVRNFTIAWPPYKEQIEIQAFLDHETARIDALVKEQQRLIALLKEKRQAVISHAVTKGLNPDVPMKDSGVEWLGEVPEHWGVRGLTKLIGPVVDYRGRTPTKVDDGVFLVTARNIRNGRIDYEISKEYVTSESVKSLLQRGMPEIGDLLFTMEAPLGQVALIDRTDIALAQRIVKFRAVKGLMINTYLMYWLMSTGCQSRMETLATGSTALGIKASKLGMIECPVPPVTEQIEIVNLIERESSKHDILLAEAQTNIDLLRERRSALISAAVTGKIDVRGWQPPASSAGATGEATQVEAE
ncbi:restriction endonuclease subunit S [Halomonas sp. Alg239-R46]|uniref:restriction endonuclease subunit S n=1 Tax=Halomonas sp. Alg239-R46 TaxID=2993445 RepID=UPI00248E0505|nr:restriction endonuclease subunit S [Halomonas sp. Alg239-R46]